MVALVMTDAYGSLRYFAISSLTRFISQYILRYWNLIFLSLHYPYNVFHWRVPNLICSTFTFDAFDIVVTRGYRRTRLVVSVQHVFWKGPVTTVAWLATNLQHILFTHLR